LISLQLCAIILLRHHENIKPVTYFLYPMHDDQIREEYSKEESNSCKDTDIC